MWGSHLDERQQMSPQLFYLQLLWIHFVQCWSILFGFEQANRDRVWQQLPIALRRSSRLCVPGKSLRSLLWRSWSSGRWVTTVPYVKVCWRRETAPPLLWWWSPSEVHKCFIRGINWSELEQTELKKKKKNNDKKNSKTFSPSHRSHQWGRSWGVCAVGQLPRHSVQTQQCRANVALQDQVSADVPGFRGLQSWEPFALPLEPQTCKFSLLHHLFTTQETRSNQTLHLNNRWKQR